MASKRLLQMLFLLAVLCAWGSDMPIRVVLRYDDYSEKSDTVLEEELISILAAEKTPCLFGVIPLVSEADVHACFPRDFVPLSAPKLEILKSAVARGIVTVAMHGVSHQTRGPGPEYGEFIGLGVEDQIVTLRNGQEFLQRALGQRLDVFVPPWNRYDSATVDALKRLGFQCLSGDLMGKPAPGLKMLPATCGLGGVRTAIGRARKVVEWGSSVIIVVLFHRYDFIERDPRRGIMNLSDFARLLRWLAGQQDVAVVAANELLTSGEDLGWQRYAANHRLTKHWPWIPPWGRIGRTDGVYLETGDAVLLQASHLKSQVLTSVLVYGGVGCLAWAAASAGVKLASRLGIHGLGMWRITLVVGIMVVLATLFCGFLDGSLGWRAATLSWAITAAILGMWWTGSRPARDRRKARAEHESW